MNRTTLRFDPVDGDAMQVVFSPALTPQMRAELSEVLDGPSTREEILAVVAGLTEDWDSGIARLPLMRHWLN
jgi:hypothetical protein